MKGFFLGIILVLIIAISGGAIYNTLVNERKVHQTMLKSRKEEIKVFSSKNEKEKLKNISSESRNNKEGKEKLNENCLCIGNNFTDNNINVIFDIAKNKGYICGNYTPAPIINVDYYSIVNGKKYYMLFANCIPENNYNMNPVPPMPNENGNFSNVKFVGFVDTDGGSISYNQFINGKLSFNIKTLDNLNDKDISNMIRKIVIMYESGISVVNKPIGQKAIIKSALTNNNSQININLNNTKNIKGEKFYEVEIVKGEPIYVALTGMIYVQKESYLGPIFNVPVESNQKIYEQMKNL